MIARSLVTIVLVATSQSMAANADSTTLRFECVPAPDMSARVAHYPANRPPLQPSPLIRLPLGSVQARGWLQHQLDLMAEGQVGQLSEISRFLTADSGWLGGEERGWEEAGEAYAKWFWKRLTKLEERLADREFLCADRFTVADVCCGFALILAESVGLDEDVPDNLKSGVSKACRYDPHLNPSYQQLSALYQVAVIPARP